MRQMLLNFVVGLALACARRSSHNACNPRLCAFPFYCSSAATPRIAVAVATPMTSDSPTTDEIS
jgi:hypothetical protein